VNWQTGNVHTVHSDCPLFFVSSVFMQRLNSLFRLFPQVVIAMSMGSAKKKPMTKKEREERRKRRKEKRLKK
jgi:hypothetical protein